MKGFFVQFGLSAFLALLGSHAVMAQTTTTSETNLVGEYKEQFDEGTPCEVAMNRQIRALDALSDKESFSVLSTEVRHGICYGQIQATSTSAE